MMNNSFQQLVQNLEYLKLKQMTQHVNEVVDFSVDNQLSFVESQVSFSGKHPQGFVQKTTCFVT